MVELTLGEIVGGHIKSIQRGTKNLSGVSSGTTTITEVDLDKSFVSSSCRPQSGSSSGSPQHIATAYLSDSTTMTFNRGASTNSTTIAWEVIEYE